MNIAWAVTDLIGGTPLVRLNRVVGDCGATILGKLESVALHMCWRPRRRQRLGLSPCPLPGVCLGLSPCPLG